MVTVNDLQRLQGLSGIQLLDAASDLVGMPRPSDYSKPITTARPEVLADTAAEWEAVASKVRAQRASVQQHVDAAMKNWSGEAADSFRAYSTQLLRSLEAQESALNEIPPVVAGMQSCITKSNQQWYEWVSFAAQTLASGFIGLAVGLIVGLLVGGPYGAVIGGIIGFVVGIIVSVLWQLLNHYVNGIIERDKCLDERRRKMDKQGERARENEVRAVDPPPDPVITGPGFGSIDLPSQFGAADNSG